MMALLQASILVSSCYRQASRAHLILWSIERSLMERVIKCIERVQYDSALEGTNDASALEGTNDAQEVSQREEMMDDLADSDSLVVDEPQPRQAVAHESVHAASDQPREKNCLSDFCRFAEL